MALRFIDSFQHYTTATILDKWSALSNSPTVVGTGSGRWGGQSMQQGDIDWLVKTIDSQATWIMGVAYIQVAAPQGSFQPIMELRDNGTIHTQLMVRSDGRLETARNGSSLGGISTTSVGTGAWFYIEQLVTIHDTAGVFQVRINGSLEINQSSIDTRNGANSSANQVGIRGTLGGSNHNWKANDFYACDTSGSAPTNTFLGDCRIECLNPDGNGNSSQLVGSDSNSTDNYLLVDEALPNDADYVESSTPGDKDTYTYANLATATGLIYGVQPCLRAQKTDAGSRTIVSVARLSGTEVDSAAVTLGTGIGNFYDIRETKPGGGSWGISDVNSAEFGVKIAS